MASLSHSHLTDFYSQKSTCKEASSSMLQYPNSTSNNMHIQGLYSLKHALHPKYPHHAPTPSQHYDHYTNLLGKPFSYYSSNVPAMNISKGDGEIEEPSSLLLSPHQASASTITSTSQDDHQVISSLHHPHKQPGATDRKGPRPSAAEGPRPSAAVAAGGELHAGNAAASKKRMRAAAMECKDTDKKEADAKKRTKVSDCESTDLHRKSEVTRESTPKPTISNAEKLKATSPLKHMTSINTEQKSPDTKSSVTKASSPTFDHGSPTAKPDFIHVRARRGQATDSHSLAERVRREKISERMKYLQDLVPSCIKVTGKAMMLDEIINYVQSLQRQVEFLSMKLAAVPPSRLEFSFDDLFGCKKQVVQPSNLNGTCLNVPGSGAAVQAFAPPTDHINNIHSDFINTMMRSNDIFHESVQSHDMDSSMQLPTLNHEMSMGCNPADSFFETLPAEFGGNDALLHQSAAGSSNCSLVASPADVVLDPPAHSCISQSSQLDMEWDDDLQNIVQQMGCFSQASSSWLPASDHLLTEGLFLQGTLKEEL